MAINTAGQTVLTYNETVCPTVVGTITYDATAITTTDYTRIATGFDARYVCIENVTDRIKLEWYKGMAANTWIKTVAAGTRTLDTTSAMLVVNKRSVDVLQDGTFGVIAASKVVAYKILG